MAKYKVIDKGTVDGEIWHSLICDGEIASWLFDRDASSYYYIGATSSGVMFDIPESTLIMLKLVFS